MTSKLTAIGRGLTRLNNYPIGKAALTVVLMLDVFILMSIFRGLDDHSDQLASPYDVIPAHCRAIVVDRTWSPNNALDKIAQAIPYYKNDPDYRNPLRQLNDVHAACRPLLRMLEGIANDRLLAASLGKQLRLGTQIGQVNSKLEKIRGAYDTSLLETIAQQNSANNEVAELKARVRELTAKLNQLSKEQRNVAQRIVQAPAIAQLLNLIGEPSADAAADLEAELIMLRYWQPVKRLGMELLFLLPLICAFYFWNSRSLRANRPYQTLVSAHLLTVACIPVVFKVFELLHDIIPYRFFTELFDLLRELNAVAIWHYLMMAVVIAVALALTYLLQMKVFSHQRLIKKRIAKSLCQNCGVGIGPQDNACALCGFKQFKSCDNCAQSTYVFAPFCRECGELPTQVDE
tara:strand:+ start:183 stop:1394 length:1212 start_codon:yes stop_codon:yes gene_type:complete